MSVHLAQSEIRAITVGRRLLQAHTERSGACLVWTRGCNGRGYAEAQIDKRRWAMHRLSYLIHHGQIPEGMMVMHSCDNRRCVNPEHLSLGSHQDNMTDMAQKRRSPNGPGHHAAKLTGTDIPVILRLAAEGRVHREIAERFGVSRATITKVVNGSAYKHERAANQEVHDVVDR